MSTLTELVNDVGDDLTRYDLTAQCSAAVVSAIRQIDQKRWWFSEATATFTTTSTTSNYSLPTDFKAMSYLEARWPGSNWQEVRERSWPDFRRMLEGTTISGPPQYYALWGNRIYLAYAPDTEYLVKEYYVKNLAELSGAQSNEMTTDCESLVRGLAAQTVALRTMHDPELAQMFEPIVQREWLSLYEENMRRVASGPIRAWR